MQLTFLGGAGTVTGSKTLIEFSGRKVMVDCGLFQGLKALRQLNRQPLPVEPESIDAVILTHAHLDHTGYLPLLVKNGFKGSVFATAPTCDLTRIILRDSAMLQEEEARLANEGGYTAHSPALPLYTRQDAENAIGLLVPKHDAGLIDLFPSFAFRFLRNGHILGSALVEITAGGKKVVFSGDLGRPASLLLQDPETVDSSDYLVLESTYGDRDHPVQDTERIFADTINETMLAKGILIIPTFAVERAQEIMLLINLLKDKGMISPAIPVYLDSPMGIDVTEVMMRYPGWHKLSSDFCKFICRDVITVREFTETLKIIKAGKPKIVIAGSGMLSGGRALEYLKEHAGDRASSILFVGYQAAGTRGRAMQQGAPAVKIHGKNYPVKAKIREISSLSGHADRNEIIRWLEKMKEKPKRIFLNHGEPESAEALRKLITEKTGIPCSIPGLDSHVLL